MATLDFDNVFPFNQMELTSVGGEQVVKVPPIYMKYGKPPGKLGQNGAKAWWLSNTQAAGYTPLAGGRTIYFKTTLEEPVADPTKLTAPSGWSAMSVAEHFLLCLLQLIEAGNPRNMKTTWREIEGLAMQNGFWCKNAPIQQAFPNTPVGGMLTMASSIPNMQPQSGISGLPTAQFMPANSESTNAFQQAFNTYWGTNRAVGYASPVYRASARFMPAGGRSYVIAGKYSGEVSILSAEKLRIADPGSTAVYGLFLTQTVPEASNGRVSSGAGGWTCYVDAEEAAMRSTIQQLVSRYAKDPIRWTYAYGVGHPYKGQAVYETGANRPYRLVHY